MSWNLKKDLSQFFAMSTYSYKCQFSSFSGYERKYYDAINIYSACGVCFVRIVFLSSVAADFYLENLTINGPNIPISFQQMTYFATRSLKK